MARTSASSANRSGRERTMKPPYDEYGYTDNRRGAAARRETGRTGSTPVPPSGADRPLRDRSFGGSVRTGPSGARARRAGTPHRPEADLHGTGTGHGRSQMRLTKYTHACVRVERAGAVLVVAPGSCRKASAMNGVDAVLIPQDLAAHLDAE